MPACEADAIVSVVYYSRVAWGKTHKGETHRFASRFTIPRESEDSLFGSNFCDDGVFNAIIFSGWFGIRGAPCQFNDPGQQRAGASDLL
jgi:hypothetical protein